MRREWERLGVKLIANSFKGSHMKGIILVLAFFAQVSATAAAEPRTFEDAARAILNDAASSYGRGFGFRFIEASDIAVDGALTQYSDINAHGYRAIQRRGGEFVFQNAEYGFSLLAGMSKSDWNDSQLDPAWIATPTFSAATLIRLDVARVREILARNDRNVSLFKSVALAYTDGNHVTLRWVVTYERVRRWLPDYVETANVDDVSGGVVFSGK